jgi:drug/metabolite transporter (DMT)-like permease
MEAVEQILWNQNTWVVCLLTGALLWAVRQITPPKLEKSTYWKKILRVIPLFLAAGLATIPDLRPVANSWVHSAGVGFIAGSFSQSIYDTLRDVAPKRFKATLGARAKRANGGDE